MLLKLTTVCLVILGTAWCMTDLQKKCVADFNEDLSNDVLSGTWYRVMQLSRFGGMVPSSECPTFTYMKPNSTELRRYEDEYLKPGIPYSFDDNPSLESGRLFSGLVIGKKQAKFFIMDPASQFYRPPFDVTIYQRVNADYLVYHECNSRGHVMWLMSSKRNPSSEEVEAIIQGRPELVRMQRQWFCAT